MKVGVLTSSRADYGIYLPLLNKLKRDNFFNLEIIAFGTHLSNSHGYTISEIEQNDYKTIHKISSLVSNDDEHSISTSYGLTALKFADFWCVNKYDLVFCLGDRFEMSAAVQAGIPYGIKFAHIHGGETTLGAIDNVFRHQITHASLLHFTATEIFNKKVISLIGSSVNVHTVGSLSLDGIESFNPIKKSLFYEKFKIPNHDFALVTFHPETIDSKLNILFAREMRKGLCKIIEKLNLVITMPNADTMGSIFRIEILKLKSEYPNQVFCIENFGKENYFSAMHYAKILIGNTSSGILEAATFGKYVINVGNRQKGRLQSKNVLNSGFSSEDILKKTLLALKRGNYSHENIYLKKGTAKQIISILKKYYVKAWKI
jgi:GDP/UDP-N,N'-diacetylbacillosamine 2-epimerase (hydrolysing)